MPSKLPSGMSQRSVIMPDELAGWFRDHAHRTRVVQQEHYRRALSEYRTRIEREEALPDDIDRGLSLVRRFATGDGVDLELLLEPETRIWGLP